MQSCRRSCAVISLVERWTCLVLEQWTTVDNGTRPSKGTVSVRRRANWLRKIRFANGNPCMPHRSIHFITEAAEGVTAEQSAPRRVHSPARRASCSAAPELSRGWICCFVRFRRIVLATFAARIKVVIHGNTMSLLSFCFCS